MLIRYQYRIADLLLLITVWAVVLAQGYTTWADKQDTLSVVEVSARSVVLLLGWFIGLKIANGLEFGPWKRFGMIWLGWLSVASALYVFCTFLLLFLILITFLSTGTIGVELWVLGLLALAFPLSWVVWIVSRLHKRAEAAWRSKEKVALQNQGVST
jgi:hypothetical protein